ncbi:class I SAM-dependent methyltransferase [Marinivivus vitaminiproducens]|uniref:class I SAM-dependent methyltransferase n=1 Tax=Marinivivus vitaminiproducens TaxID=3035935 RepID=UPI0027AB101A|nr:cyclopropane-fatty-acyl-phospholipid synthase [Geminicoccaceae bacterium SCSIO 64248]
MSQSLLSGNAVAGHEVIAPLRPESAVPSRHAFGQDMAVSLLRRAIRKESLAMRFGDGVIERFGEVAGDVDDQAASPVITITALPWHTWLRILVRPEVAAPRSFVDGEWTIEQGDLADLIHLFRANLGGFNANPLAKLDELRWALEFRIRRLNPVFQSKPRIQAHYDRGDHFYESFLDSAMQYSCAFFTRPEADLEEAQQHKIATIIDRLRLDRPGLKVLDVGCGWGGLSRAIAARTASDVTGITISSRQFAYATHEREAIEDAGLRERLHYEEVDYRRHAQDADGLYDRVVSIGMLEHVGIDHYPAYFRTVKRLLKPGGRALIHNIVSPHAGPTAEWIAKDVFPGGYIPLQEEVEQAIAEAGLALEKAHIHDGSNYARTLQLWRARFTERWQSDMAGNAADRRFFRHWQMYFAACENAFDSTQLGLKVIQFTIHRP